MKLAELLALVPDGWLFVKRVNTYDVYTDWRQHEDGISIAQAPSLATALGIALRIHGLLPDAKA